MGDVQAQDALSGAPQGTAAGEEQLHSSTSTSAPVFHPQHQLPFDPSQNAFSSQFDMTQPQSADRPGPYSMNAMANALPQTGYRYGASPNGQRYGGPPGVVHSSMHQMPQYAAPSGVNPLMGQQYFISPHPQVQPYYAGQMPPTQQQAHVASRHSMPYYPAPMMMNPAQQIPGGYYYGQSGPYAGQGATLPGPMMGGQHMAAPDPRRTSPAGALEPTGPMASYGGTDDVEGARSRSNVVRGPPRKPRQSGHAIWVGNLPPQTDLMSLVQHVCKEASGLESLFLISKSNCAFANFSDEQSCVKAQQKLHDSKFQSVRLVSRLRKSTVEGTAGQTAPTGPAATSPPAGSQAPPGDAPRNPVGESEEQVNTPSGGRAEATESSAINGSTQKDKFFVLKSLTVEDLELSMRNGVWATQSHNEEALNRAFQAADNVYLVFSANKSGEYFGYARMTSPINNDPAAAIEFAPKAQTTNDLDLPKAIPTEATEHCPRGSIMDDSARGTIFWEIERDETETPEPEVDDSASVREAVDADSAAKTWGKPFKLEWLSTSRLPFYRTRGLRNPWNSNREVKIARDGTELEPSVGRRLIGLFNRVQSPAPMAIGMRHGVMPAAPGYPPAAMGAAYS